MSNPNFNPVTSSDDIYFGQDDSKCLTDEVNNKAPLNHNHNSEYAEFNHEHSEYSETTHTHSQYADSNHTHTDKADLVNGKVPISQIPDDLKEIRIVSNIAARDSMTGLFAGLSAFVTDATADSTVTSGGAWYLYDGTNWIKTAESESMDAVLQWANILGKPNAYPPEAHTHLPSEAGAISKSLQCTNDAGSSKHSYNANSGKNVVSEITNLPTGMHTIYAVSGTAGNPKTTESWRYLVHKTAVNYGWVQAFGSNGSVYAGYLDNGTWDGWKCLYDESPSPLWSGAYYMSETDEVTPSKKLSECRNGWLLLWSDYDAGTGRNNYDFVTTVIPKKNATGGAWGRNSFLCDVPYHTGSDTTDTSNEKRCIKLVYISDDKIEGHTINSQGDRTDVVLRAVYEF